MQNISAAQIKASVRMEEVVRQRGVTLHAAPSGERMEGHCPFHVFDETPSFNIYVTSQRYHCFGCGANGDVIDFVQAFDLCSFQEALHRLSGNIIALPTAKLARSRVPRPILPVPFPRTETENQNELLTIAQRHYHQTLLAASALQTMLHDLRGITEQGIRCCHLGYADGSLAELLRDPEERQQEAQKAGLLNATKRERMWQRLIIPECSNEQCHWMIGRTLYQPLGGKPHLKYLGLSLRKPLLGYSLALTRLRERHLVRAILIVEGAIDYVIASQWKLPIVCVALLGTHASKQQLSMLLDLQQHTNHVPLLVGLDADDAGRQASQHLVVQLRRRTSLVSELPPIAARGKDIGDLGIHPDGSLLLQASIEQALCADSIKEGEHE